MTTSILPVVVLVAIVGYIVYDCARRLPRGGMGLQVGYVPRRLRSAVNRLFIRRGWPVPFDDDGNRRPT
ncbi:hypothetical protein [Aeromicrobium endophyticum]|uniref:Uncharacterized protein n=1 Tax=Aeromicrobium endophyticum TaxID=2292704 RepID=A0A371P9T5_9ACTN|nr:hypothetical protein [Aeromicrobium endophyticum]REK72210.1 hypothetical protein DX116_00750 [Aeromicrobium endophyticum]